MPLFRCLNAPSRFSQQSAIISQCADTSDCRENFPTSRKSASERRKRVTTSEMNRFIRQVDFEQHDRNLHPCSRPSFL